MHGLFTPVTGPSMSMGCKGEELQQEGLDHLLTLNTDSKEISGFYSGFCLSSDVASAANSISFSFFFSSNFELNNDSLFSSLWLLVTYFVFCFYELAHFEHLT